MAEMTGHRTETSATGGGSERGKRGDDMEFHEKLQQLRIKHNLTQEQLAEQLYVSRTAVSKWESGVSQS